MINGFICCITQGQLGEQKRYTVPPKKAIKKKKSDSNNETDKAKIYSINTSP